MLKGVIFDMDGVLVDNKHVHVRAFELFAQRYGFDLDREALEAVFGRGNDEIIPLLLPERIVEQKGIKALSDEKEAIYREIFRDTIAPVRGLVDYLGQIRDTGLKIAVGSSGNTENVNFVLDRCGIAGYFDAIANGDMISHGKPSPEVFLLAAKLLDLAPEGCTVIEDSFSGIRAAQSAGMKVIALTTTYTQEELEPYRPDRIVKDFTELTVEDLA